MLYYQVIEAGFYFLMGMAACTYLTELSKLRQVDKLARKLSRQENEAAAFGFNSTEKEKPGEGQYL